MQLAQMLRQQHAIDNNDIDAADFLTYYAQLRQQDHDRVIGFTDSLVKIFSHDNLALAAARNIGLLDHLPPAKALLVKHAMGLAGQLRL
jgi:2-octaprenyl-6-methoxyphenol hydroxylase